MNYEVLFYSSALKELNRLPDETFKRIDPEIRALSHTPRPPGVKKLHGNRYRIRIGPWRLIFAVFDQEQKIVVLRIARRSESTYRNFP